jgi:uncharacterized protein YggE
LAITGAGAAAVAAFTVIALSGRASEPATAAPEPPATTVAPGGAPGGGSASDGRTITVTGSGTVAVVPDTATLSVGVQANASTATEALETMSTQSQALMTALEGEGIAEDDIQTSGLSLWPTYGNDGERITGYQASTNVTATIEEIGDGAAVGDVVDALKSLVGEQLTLQGVSFSYADPEAVLQAARADAIANAKVRADQYAAAAGVEVGEVVRIVEGTVDAPVAFREMAAGAPAADAASVAVAPGSQELSATVNVVYAMR